MRHARVRVALVGCFALLAAASGCNAVLGIEQLKPAQMQEAGSGDSENPDAAAGSGGTESPSGPKGGQGGSGGSAAPIAPINQGTSGSGGKVSAPSGAGEGGSDTPAEGGRGGSGSSSDKPEGGAGGAPAAGSGGAGSSATNPGGGPVKGRVVDYYRHAIEGVTVRLGDQAVKTDAEGRFSIENAPATYDVTLNINNSGARTFWRVEGLTRRDPTLQVYSALPRRSGEAMMEVKNVTFPLPAEQRIAMRWDSPDGGWGTDLKSERLEYLSPSWVGPATSTGTAHALLFEVAGTPELPTRYLSHSSVPVTMQDSKEISFAFDLAAKNIGNAAISGTITGQSFNRANRVYARFSDNVSLELLSDWSSTDSFSYVVPSLPNVTFTVAVEDQNNFRGTGKTAVYVDNVAAGQTGIGLTLPKISTLNTPAPGKQNVDATTVFHWSGEAKVFLLVARGIDTNSTIAVLTSKSETHLPIADRDFLPPAGAAFGWLVQTHGDWANVDATAAEGGFLSPYADGDIPGVAKGSGSYTESAEASFTLTP